MSSKTEPVEDIRFLEFDTFLRKFEQRTFRIMWLLGAGASRACGIKTAEDMIWDFKARLYRSSKKVPASIVRDLSDPRVRDTLQQFFDEQGDSPALGRENEYSYYFQKTYPENQDRRTYLDQLITKAKPSFGHKALAHLMQEDLCRIVWTTNFDRVFEDAVSNVLGTQSMMTVGDLGEPYKVKRSYTEQQWPIYAKLHGDFHSDLLKNTSEEIAEQDVQMRKVFMEACRNWGLIVTGYSGRDSSILEVLDEAICEGSSFPNGLFWFIREQDKPYEGVVQLIKKAQAQGVDADFVAVGSFDELLMDIVRYLPQAEKLVVELGEREKLVPRKINLTNRKVFEPFVRTNAFPVVEYPKTCRLITVTRDIGNTKKIKEALASANSNLLASRIKKGLLMFGDDGEIKRVFENYGIERTDTHGILSERLVFESGERSLLRDALFKALETHCGLKIENDGPRHIIYASQTARTAEFGFERLAKATGQIHGVIPDTDIVWVEACSLRLDYRMENLWLLIQPFVHIDVPENVAEDLLMTAREFVRERRARRYNRKSNDIWDGWVFALFGEARSPVGIGIDGGTGIGARFEISPITAFSGLLQ